MEEGTLIGRDVNANQILICLLKIYIKLHFPVALAVLHNLSQKINMKRISNNNLIIIL